VIGRKFISNRNIREFEMPDLREETIHSIIKNYLAEVRLFCFNKIIEQAEI